MWCLLRRSSVAWRRGPVCTHVYARALVPPNLYIHTYLCARVRACAGAAESLHTYIHRVQSYLYISIVAQGGVPMGGALGISRE